MKKEPLISAKQIEEFDKIFFKEENIKEFKEFLKSLQSDEARIELIKTQGKNYLNYIGFFKYRNNQLHEFLNSINSYDHKLKFIKDFYDDYQYGVVNFPYEILDILKPDDRKKFIQDKDMKIKSQLFNNIISIDQSEVEKSKKIFFANDDVKIDENFKILCDAKTNFQILSLLANSNNFGLFAGEKRNLFMHHNSKIKQELPENPLPDIYAEMMIKINSDQAIELSEGNKLFLRESKLRGHSSYFIFHINAHNQLTKIGYCDGNKVSNQQAIDKSLTHINSITNYELANPIDFSAEFADKFIKENSEKLQIEDLYNKISAENFKFKGLEENSISSITYEMPRAEQKRGNCSMKSANILACAILKLKDPSQEFIWDGDNQKPAGKGYENYKEYKDTLSKLALEELEIAMPEIKKMTPKIEGYKRDLFEAIQEVCFERIEYAKKHFSSKVKKRPKEEKQVIDFIEEDSKSTPSCISFLSFIGKFFSKNKDGKLSPPSTITSETQTADIVFINKRG